MFEGSGINLMADSQYNGQTRVQVLLDYIQERQMDIEDLGTIRRIKLEQCIQLCQFENDANQVCSSRVVLWQCCKRCFQFSQLFRTKNKPYKTLIWLFRVVHFSFIMLVKRTFANLVIIFIFFCFWRLLGGYIAQRECWRLGSAYQVHFKMQNSLRRSMNSFKLPLRWRINLAMLGQLTIFSSAKTLLINMLALLEGKRGSR